MVSVVSSSPTGGNFNFLIHLDAYFIQNDRNVRFVLFTNTSIVIKPIVVSSMPTGGKFVFCHKFIESLCYLYCAKRSTSCYLQKSYKIGTDHGHFADFRRRNILNLHFGQFTTLKKISLIRIVVENKLYARSNPFLYSVTSSSA